MMTLRRAKNEEAKTIGFDGDYSRPTVMPRTHQHQEVELNFLSRGSMRYLIGGVPHEIPSCRFCVLWGAAPHQVIHVAEGTEFYWFTIPLSWLLQWGMPSGFLETLFRGELLIARDAIPMDEMLCQQWKEDLKAREPERLRIAQLEMEARLRRLALAGSSARRRRSGTKAPALPVHRMAETIARRYTESLSAADIADAARLHPNYAMNLFKKTFGMSMLDYLTQHRLFHARRLLATTDDKIADIAFASGFGSLNRFYTIFQEANACSPRQYRQRFF